MSRKAKIILSTALLLLMAVFALCYLALVPEANAGEKHIVFSVTNLDGLEKSFDIHTDAETLADALLEQKLIDGESGPYGLYVRTVFGISADEKKQEYWMFSRDGELLPAGVSDTYIADGDHYEAYIAQY